MEDMEAPETPRLIQVSKTITPGKNKFYKEFFEYLKGDITELKADIIVNSLPPSMNPYTGVSKSIYNKCGDELLNYLKKNYNGLIPGGIVDSPSFKLDCKEILHVCGPEEEKLLELIYIQCLNYCYTHYYHSIIFPCISTGGKGFDEEKACSIAINTCKEWIDKYSKYWKIKITFCCFTDKSYIEYKKYFKELLYIL